MPEPAAKSPMPWPDPAEEPLDPPSAADLASFTSARSTAGPYALGPDSTAQRGCRAGA